jgi:hypothetical protein
MYALRYHCKNCGEQMETRQSYPPVIAGQSTQQTQVHTCHNTDPHDEGQWSGIAVLIAYKKVSNGGV